MIHPYPIPPWRSPLYKGHFPFPARWPLQRGSNVLVRNTVRRAHFYLYCVHGGFEKSKDVLYGVWLFWPKCQASLQGVRPPETLFSQFTLQRKLTISHGFTFNILGNNFNQLDDKSGAFACLVQVLTPSCIASVQRFLTAGRATILLIGLTAQMDGWTCYFVHMGILATQAIWVFVGGP